jgi:ERCC4-type nuclease
VEEMSIEELLKYIGSSATFFSRKNKELKTAEAKGEDTAKIKQAIQEREFKLNLVNEKLGVGK